MVYHESESCWWVNVVHVCGCFIGAAIIYLHVKKRWIPSILWRDVCIFMRRLESKARECRQEERIKTNNPNNGLSCEETRPGAHV